MQIANLYIISMKQRKSLANVHRIMKVSLFLSKKIFFNVYLLQRERERERERERRSMNRGGTERGRDTESEAGSRL